QQLEMLSSQYSQSPLVQGALFHLQSLLNPQDEKYRLAGKICLTPFVQADVLDGTTHLCCASWLQTSIGNMGQSDWQAVWNSDAAQAIRESIHDGSYRYCNKSACPIIQSGGLTPAAELRTRSDFWRDIIDASRTEVSSGPEVVNLAYDRTCNLSCPSCRVERFAADEATRGRYEEMQQRTILPLLKGARTVFVTGSGDPFSSKNFRRLLQQLTPEAYPDLRFQIMTNGMLFTPRQWTDFPSIHRRVAMLKISVDAATGPTHELLRRGARWPVMLENMAFAGRLLADGLIDNFELVFTVQRENYREMGAAIDLARKVGARQVWFGRITNWGTFTEQEYRDKAVFLSGHPEHQAFLAAMADPRLRDPMVIRGDLDEFLPDIAAAA
ncbi:MAG TPA: radical SAM protein, partial [Sphingomonas sp.]|nr:radical SAM protein [Sphingomonas sp.]